MRRRFAWSVLGGFVVLPLSMGGSAARAGVTEFSRDLSGFNTAAGNPSVEITFDAIATGTNVGGTSIGGATLSSNGSDPIVVNAAETATTGLYNRLFNASNHLTATTGANVLSPGGVRLLPGPNALFENDGLRVEFADAVNSFGFDLLSQRADGFSFTTAQVLDADGHELFSGNVAISALTADGENVIPGGSDFWGVVSNENNIKTVVLTESDHDSDNPDNNVGYDTFRFAANGAPTPPPAAIPLPPAIATFPLVAAAAGIAIKKFRRA